MYRFIFTLIVIPTFFFGQVGVNTLYPIGVFHVDGAGDNPASSPTAGNLANDFWVDSRGNVGIGTTTLNANTRMTILPNATDRNGIHFEYPGSGTISSASRAININVTTNANIDGLLYTNSTTANSSFYGVGSLLSAGNIVSSFLGYRNGSGLSFGLLTITGTTGAYSRTANTWALFSRGRAEISADSSPSDIAGVDLQIRNTTSGASNPATVMMRQSTSQTTNDNLLARLDFGDAHDTSTQARIEVARDAAGGAGDFPTRITFSTTPDGSSTLTERMRISNNGFVGIGTTGTRTLDVNGDLRVRTVTASGTPSMVSPRIWASDTSGNLATLMAAQVVSEGGGLSLVNVTSPIAGNGTVGSPISLNDLGVTTIKLADNAVTTAKISNANVTYAKIQNIAASRFLGNPTGSAAAPSEIGLGSGLAFDGTNLVAKPIVTIPLFSANEGYKDGNGQINYFQTGNSQGSSWFLAFRNILDPQIVNTSGNIQVKLVLWINNFTTSGNTNFRLNANNVSGSSSTLFDTSTGGGGAVWQTGFGGVVLNTNWVNFSAGTSGYAQFYLDQNISGTSSINVFNAYLLVRSQ